MAGALQRARVDGDVDVGALCFAYHDVQRLKALVARSMIQRTYTRKQREQFALEAEEDAPRMHSDEAQQPGHRNKTCDWIGSLFVNAVARKVPRNEWPHPRRLQGQTAQDALDAEWNRLRDMPWPNKKGKGTWDESKVQSARAVRENAKRNGETVHFCRICELLYEKHSELPEGDPLKKFKGRDVLLGENVKDENFDWAQFGDLVVLRRQWRAREPSLR